MLGAGFVYGVMAGPAHPERSGDQVFFAKQFLEAFFAVQVFGDQVMPGEPANRAFAEFTVVRLGWKFEHCGNTSRVSPLAPPDLRYVWITPNNQCIRV